MRTFILASCLLAGALIPTTTLGQIEPDPSLANSSWQVQETPGDVSENSPLGLTFRDDETLTVQSECPAGSGTYEVLTGGGITIDVDEDTLAGCEEAQATAFIAQLELAASYDIDENGLLTITLSDGKMLVFDPALIGVTWEWLEFQSSIGTTVDPAADDVHQVLFNDGGTVSIETPCASGSGTFQDTADGLDLDLTGIDASDCAADSPTALLLRDLDMATSYVIREGQLFIALPMDGGIHQFQPVYETEEAT